MMKHSSQNGFTLLEVLLAVAVLSILLLYLINAYNHLQYAYVHRGNHTQAAFLIQQNIFDAHYVETRKRKITGVKDNFSYTILQKPLSIKPFRKIDTSLEWPDLRKPQRMSLATVIYHEQK